MRPSTRTSEPPGGRDGGISVRQGARCLPCGPPPARPRAQKERPLRSGYQAAARSTARRQRSRSSGSPGSTVTRRAPGGGDVVPARPGADGQAGQEGRRPGSWPRARATPRRAAAWRRRGPARRWGCRSSRRRPAASGCSSPVSVSADSTRSAPRWATPSSTARTICGRSLPAGEAEQRAAGAVVPPRGAEPEEGRHVDHAVGGGAAAATSWLVRGVGDDAEVVAQPLDVGAGREHHRLDAPRELAAAAPGHDREACRPRPGARSAGRSRTEAEVEHPAGAEGDLGVAGGARSPARRGYACWSPTSAAIGGAPSRAVARPEHAARVDDGRQASTRGMRSASSTLSSQSPAVAAQQAGDGRRSMASVAWTAPSERCQASQVSTVPKHRSRAAVGVGQVEEVAELGGRRVRRHADAVALQHQAGADGAQVLPADGRADGLAGGPVPHDRRRPLVGDARPRRPGRPRRARRAASSSATRASSAASNSTRPGLGGRRAGSGRWCSTAIVASGRTAAARSAARADVDHEDGHGRVLPGRRRAEDGPEPRRAPGAEGQQRRGWTPRPTLVRRRPASAATPEQPGRRRWPSSRQRRRVRGDAGPCRDVAAPTIQPPNADARAGRAARTGRRAARAGRRSPRAASATWARSAAGRATARAQPAPIATRRPSDRVPTVRA